MKEHSLITYIKLFRPVSVLAMNAFIFLPILFLTHSVFFSVMQTLPFIFLISGEIALNDCCDVEKDKINKPQRPLVNSNINIHHAFIVSICVIVLSLTVGIVIYYADLSRILCFLLVASILSVYNLKLPFIPLLKTVMTAIATLISLSFLYTYVEISHRHIFFLCSAFFFILGRELLMDIRDIDGDKSNNYKTIAVVFGINRTRRLAFISFGISAIFALSILAIDFSYLNLAILLIIVFFEFFFFIKCVKTLDSKKQNKYILFLWLPMILMLLLQML